MGDTITARLPCKHGVHDSHPTLDPAAQRASDRVGWCDGYQEITLRRVYADEPDDRVLYEEVTDA